MRIDVGFDSPCRYEGVKGTRHTFRIQNPEFVGSTPTSLTNCLKLTWFKRRAEDAENLVRFQGGGLLTTQVDI